MCALCEVYPPVAGCLERRRQDEAPTSLRNAVLLVDPPPPSRAPVSVHSVPSCARADLHREALELIRRKVPRRLWRPDIREEEAARERELYFIRHVLWWYNHPSEVSPDVREQIARKVRGLPYSDNFHLDKSKYTISQLNEQPTQSVKGASPAGSSRGNDTAPTVKVKQPQPADRPSRRRFHPNCETCALERKAKARARQLAQQGVTRDPQARRVQ